MYPLFRLLVITVKAKRGHPLGPTDLSEISFITRPWDIDVFFEMNNGRALTLYDLGRFDLSIRCGFTRALAKNRWGLAVAGSTTQYRKRIRVFNKVTMRTRLVAVDEKWIYVNQSMWLGETPASSVLLRTCVTSRDGVVPTAMVMNAMGVSKEQQNALKDGLPEWAALWEQADKQRPWPPKV